MARGLTDAAPVSGPSRSAPFGTFVSRTAPSDLLNGPVYDADDRRVGAVRHVTLGDGAVSGIVVGLDPGGPFAGAGGGKLIDLDPSRFVVVKDPTGAPRVNVRAQSSELRSKANAGSPSVAASLSNPSVVVGPLPGRGAIVEITRIPARAFEATNPR